MSRDRCERCPELKHHRGYKPTETTIGQLRWHYYLMGLLVGARWRRHGLGELLTAARLAWVWERAAECWFFANARNGASLDLHARLGFHEVRRDFSVPGVTFTGGEGILCRAMRPDGTSS